MKSKNLILSNLEKFNYDGESFKIIIKPFEYEDNKKSRLPRKSSKGYNLVKDVNVYFQYVLSDINFKHIDQTFIVRIIVEKGKDKLGKADLDNYAKAILDGITNSKKIWKDDKFIDYLLVKRVYTQKQNSIIKLIIKISL